MRPNQQQNDGPFGESHVAVIGGGSIGVAFAVVFAKAGIEVKLVEPSEVRRSKLPAEVNSKLQLLLAHDLLDTPIAEIENLVSIHSEPTTAVPGAALVQECAPENVELKQTLFREIASLTDVETVLASSSSFMPSSTSAEDSDALDRTLVAHPGNPPFAIPIIELVPNPKTRSAVVSRSSALYRSAGLSPVLVKEEVEGFIFNRIQGAVLREAYSLVRDGIASVDDVDAVVREGLGRRWSFMGPFETVDLNTRGGIAAHAEKMGPAYHRMGMERGDQSEWTPDLVEKVELQRRELLSLDKWEERVAWRDENLLQQAKRATLRTISGESLGEVESSEDQGARG